VCPTELGGLLYVFLTGSWKTRPTVHRRLTWTRLHEPRGRLTTVTQSGRSGSPSRHNNKIVRVTRVRPARNGCGNHLSDRPAQVC